MSWWRERRLKSRGLFKFHDGAKWRWDDPLAIWQRLFSESRSKGMEFEDLGKAIQENDPSKISTAIVIIGNAFGVSRWDSGTQAGLTDAEILTLLDALADYVGSQKKTIESGQS